MKPELKPEGIGEVGEALESSSMRSTTWRVCRSVSGRLKAEVAKRSTLALVKGMRYKYPLSWNPPLKPIRSLHVTQSVVRSSMSTAVSMPRAKPERLTRAIFPLYVSPVSKGIRYAKTPSVTASENPLRSGSTFVRSIVSRRSRPSSSSPRARLR